MFWVIQTEPSASPTLSFPPTHLLYCTQDTQYSGVSSTPVQWDTFRQTQGWLCLAPVQNLCRQSRQDKKQGIDDSEFVLCLGQAQTVLAAPLWESWMRGTVWPHHYQCASPVHMATAMLEDKRLSWQTGWLTTDQRVCDAENSGGRARNNGPGWSSGSVVHVGQLSWLEGRGSSWNESCVRFVDGCFFVVVAVFLCAFPNKRLRSQTLPRWIHNVYFAVRFLHISKQKIENLNFSPVEFIVCICTKKAVPFVFQCYCHHKPLHHNNFMKTLLSGTLGYAAVSYNGVVTKQQQAGLMKEYARCTSPSNYVSHMKSLSSLEGLVCCFHGYWECL